MSSENKIKLNFLPLDSQEFEFRIWRKNYTNSSKLEGIQKKSLPKLNNMEDRADYWVSFEPIDGYEEFSCKSEYNNYLTMDYLFHLLKIKSREKFPATEIIIYEKFRKNISFVLEHSQYGDATVWLEPYYLSAQKKIGFLVGYKFKVSDPKNKNMREVLRLSLSLDQNYRSNKNYYLDKFGKAQKFIKEFKDKLFPLQTNSQNNISLNMEFQEIDSNRLESKQFIFANNQTNSSQFKGITSYGPLKELGSDVSFYYIFKKEHENLVLDLKQALRGQLQGIMFNGLSKVFHLEIENEFDCIIDDYSDKSLQSAIDIISNFKEKTPEKIILPIFVEDKDNHSAYYFLKFHLLKHKISVQTISHQLLGRRDQFKWSVSNLALQIFVKLGGMPWKVSQKSDSLIFGLGQSHKFIDNRIVKYFAYSVCTDSSGIYKKINILANSDNESSYLTQFTKQLISAINDNLAENFSRCVLHVPFKIKSKELVCINDAINTLKNTHSDIDFIVIRINTDHQFFGYANTNSLIPYEGTYITIRHKPKQYLLWVDGLQQNNSAIFQQTQDPIFIEFYWSSKALNDEETIEILQEILNMSGSSWRGFNPSKIPISIKYCRLISDYLKEFPTIVDNLEQISTPWFV